MKTESVIDFPKATLCPEIWEKVVDQNGMNEIWQLKPEVEEKIIAIYNKLQRDTDTTFSGARITGSITSNSYTENADIDLHISISNIDHVKDDPKIADFYNRIIKEKYNKVYIGKHPIEVYYQPNEFQDYMSVGCYDIINHEWLVGPELIDQSFNPYSEYYKEIQLHSDKIVNNIRNVIFSIYEITIVFKKNINNEFGKNIRNILIYKLQDAKNLFENIRQTRKIYSSPESIEQALKYRSSRKWKIADASFKLFDKYGYTAILRRFVELLDILQNSNDVDIEIIDDILSTVKNYINNVDKLSEQELFGDSMQIDEDFKNVASSFALALALLIPGLVQADTIRYAKSKNGTNIQKIYKKENIFKQMLNDKQPNDKFGDYNFWQSVNILALTLFGEGRSEISNGGFDLICDSILNRTAANTPDLKRVANICLGKKDGKAYQYSFWNKNKSTINTILKQNNAVVPTSITNVVEKRAWETCIDRSIKILTNNYTVTNKKINSYYVTNMKNPPDWADELTDVETAGKHTFGYVKTNDPKYVDMATMTSLIGKKDNIYVVKPGDTLWNIANNNNTTVKKLKEKNNIKDESKIKVGQKIKL